MPSCKWTRPATDDLKNILRFMAQTDRKSALSYTQKLKAKAELQLTSFPSSGKAGRVHGTRELVISPYIVAYRVKGDSIEIIAVVHEAQAWPEQ